MHNVSLADEFVDRGLEQSLLAAIQSEPTLYWELLDSLPTGSFPCEREAWENLASALQSGSDAFLPDDWKPCEAPQEAARRLGDLTLRRLLADAQQQVAALLYNLNAPVEEVAGVLQDRSERVQATLRENGHDDLFWGKNLVADVMQMAEERRRQREETGKSLTGIPTGLPRLDDLLNGFNPGLYVLGGAPGVGKTSLALQMAVKAATGCTPALYVSYENTPQNLVLKSICACARVPAADVERGFAEIEVLETAASHLEQPLSRIALIEGTSALTMADVRARALQTIKAHKAQRCLIVFDYLQRAAHNSGYDQLRHNVSKLTGELRELSTRLNSPVLALASQNRAAGDYGTKKGSSGSGSASLDSLKESGDLEYSADVVLFLTKDPDRTTQEPARAIKLTVAKNRFGALGSVSLMFRADHGVLSEEESRYE